MGECPTDGYAGLSIQDDPQRLAAYPSSRDGSDLAGYDDARSRLTGLTGRDGHVARVPRLAPGGGDGAHGHEARPVERLVRDDQGAPRSSLVVTLCGIEVRDDDRPAQSVRHAGHVSASADL